MTDDGALSIEAALAQRPSSRQRVLSVGWRVLLPGLTMVAMVGLWWLAVIVLGWKPFIVPNPGQVWSALVARWDVLPGHIQATLIETLEGYALAIAIGMPIAIAIAYSRFLEATVYPVLVALNSIPKIAIAPLLVIWMGFGSGPKIAMVVLICFFPIVISTATGLESTPPELLELVRSLSASRLQQFAKVRFPAALPHVFVGLKVAISLAVIGAVVGEFVGATKGLGYVIITSGQNADTALAFAAIALLSVMSVVLFYAVVVIERVVVPWSAEERPS